MNKKSAVNWNKSEDDFSLTFYNQNVVQMWSPEEIPISKDLQSWRELSVQEKDTYVKTLAGLTLLDTQQGCEGLPLMILQVTNKQQKAVLGFMEMMEHIHAKSYSSIFTTILSEEEITKAFDFVEENHFLQSKSLLIDSYYNKLFVKKAKRVDVYLGLVASCFLEYYLFYTGFFYPLYLSAQGKMTSSGEVIKLIIRDEIIHGLYVSKLANSIYKELSEEDKDFADLEFEKIFRTLENYEHGWTRERFEKLGLYDEVRDYMKYNANRTFELFNKPLPYEGIQINPAIKQGIDTVTSTHDFFSSKGNGYVKDTGIVDLDDDSVFS